MMRRIDLLPPAYLERRRERRVLAAVVVGGLVVLLLLIAYWFYVGTQISDANDELAAVEARNAALRTEIAELQRFADLAAEVEAKQTALQTVFAGDVSWPSLMTEVAMVIPGEVWLTNMSGSGTGEGASPVGTETAAIRISSKTPVGRIQFQGSALSMPAVAKWLIRLGTVEAFDAIWLNSAAESGEETAAFVTFDSTLELGDKALSRRFQRFDQ
ncbi:MAG: PilN domain-containing protein [Actinomycetota bacterium]